MHKATTATPQRGRTTKGLRMKNVSASSGFDYFALIMEEARAGFEFDCQQVRRGFKVSMAVKIFGVGTLLPNNLAGYERDFVRLSPPETRRTRTSYMPCGKLATGQLRAKKQ